jgi:hypothetical protein
LRSVDRRIEIAGCLRRRSPWIRDGAAAGVSVARLPFMPFDCEALTLAVVAAVRHADTPYGARLMSGVDHDEARRRLQAEVDEILVRWRTLTA